MLLKKRFIAVVLFSLIARAASLGAQESHFGDVHGGASPKDITYQGRLEKDGLPFTGKLYGKFKIYDGAGSSASCLWGPVLDGICSCSSCTGASEVMITVSRGIFNVSIQPPVSVIGTAGDKYLQVEIDGNVLSPREKLKSYQYSLISSYLEPGNDQQVNSLMTAYDVYLATQSGQVGIGESSVNSLYKVEVNGDINLSGNLRLNGYVFNVNGQTSVSAISSSGDTYLKSDEDTILGGDLIFLTSQIERMRLYGAVIRAKLAIAGDINNATGRLGIFTRNGLVTRNTSTSYDKSLFRMMPYDNTERSSRLELYSMSDATAIETDPSAYVRGVVEMSSSSFRIGMEQSSGLLVNRDTVFVSGGTDVGVLSSTGTMSMIGGVYTTSGLRADNITVASYVGQETPGLPYSNDISSYQGTDLVIQNSNTGNVGIGTNSPAYKLDVAGNIKASGGVVSESAQVTGPLTISGNLTINNPSYGSGNTVVLSTATVYGNSVVHGALTVDNGIDGLGNTPAYLAKTQTFSGINTFSDIYSVAGKGVVVGAPAYPYWLPARYLHVVGGTDSPRDGRIYLVAGAGNGTFLSSVNSEVRFYRADTQLARVGTSAGDNLNFEVGASTPLAFSSDGTASFAVPAGNYVNISGGGLSISTYSAAGTPALYVDPATGNVGVWTNSLTSSVSPNPVLTVAGEIRITDASKGIVFGDGTFLNTANPSGGQSAEEILSPGDAAVYSGSLANGRVELRAKSSTALVVKKYSGQANVGIGTLTPSDILQVSDGNIKIGRTFSYPGALTNSIIAEGPFMNGGNVLLAAASGAKVGIGTDSPQGKLDVNGNLAVGGIQVLSVTGDASSVNNFNMSGVLTSNLADAEAFRFSGAGAGIGFTGTGANTITMASSGRLNAGKVGVNISAPAYTLDVNGTSRFSGQAIVVGSATVQGTALTVNTQDISVVGTKTGIGIAAPLYILDVAGGIIAGADGTRTTFGTDGSVTIPTILSTAYGGTGRATIPANGVLYGAGVSPVAYTSVTTENTALTSSGAAPEFGGLDFTNSSTVGASVLSAANGGTGAASLTANAVVYGNGSSSLQTASFGSTGNVLVSGGTGNAPSFGRLSLAQSGAVGSSVLGISNGGTNTSSFSSSQFLNYSGSAIVSSGLSSSSFMSPTVASVTRNGYCSTVGQIGYDTDSDTECCSWFVVCTGHRTTYYTYLCVCNTSNVWTCRQASHQGSCD